MPFAGIDEAKLLHAFLEESEELLEKLNHCLLELEKDTSNVDRIHEIFRLTHSLKSESALVGYNNLSEVAHKLEDTFEKIRGGKLLLTKPLMDGILAASDLIHEMIGSIARGSGDDLDARLILDELSSQSAAALIGDSAAAPVRARAKARSGDILAPPADLLERALIEECRDRGARLYRLSFHIEEEPSMRYARAYLALNNLELASTVLRSVPDLSVLQTDDVLKDQVSVLLASSAEEAQIRRACQVDGVEILSLDNLSYPELLDKEAGVEVAGYEEAEGGKRPAPAPEEGAPPPSPAPAARNPAERPGGREHVSIRVDTRKLNELWGLVGELFLCKAGLSRLHTTYKENNRSEQFKDELELNVDVLERVTAGIQQTMMETRMVPIAVLFSKFPRLVRDLSRKLQKLVELKIEGEETEIDRTIVEVLSDPLTHILRNALDHGIEPREIRRRAGKSETGVVSISARQQGGKIVIEVADDGRGLDLEKIRRKSGAGPEVSNEELIQYIFQPGFSTKEEVTDLSGRGVGMDVVATRIKDELKGEVIVKSSLGAGMRITILLPLTLTILHSLIIRCGEHHYAIPIRDIDETIKLGAEAKTTEEGVPTMVDLTVLLHLQSEGTKSEDRCGVVLRHKTGRICLLADELVDEEDVVIKPVDPVLNDRGLFSGVSILGSGRILFVLDTARIVELSALVE